MDRLLFKKGFVGRDACGLLIVSVVATASVPMLHKKIQSR